MDKEIVIVTAFFDIHRESFEVYQRSADQYINYFRFWARIKNRVIIYCQQQNYDRILQIRSEFGLKDKTDIIALDNFFCIEPEIYKQMCDISHKKDFCSSRYFDVAISNRSDYDYIMLLKYWCMFDASKRVDENVFFAWIDFGFNHGGKLYTNPEDFSFKWEYDFDNHISIFCLSDPRKMIGIDSLQFKKDCVMGTFFVVPKHMIKDFWYSMRCAMLSLISLDCIDDDQQLLLMVFKLHKDWFTVIQSDWFELFLICSSQHFTIKKKTVIENRTNNVDKKSEKVNVLKLKKLVRKLIPARKKNVDEIDVSQSRKFAERMYQKSVKYYGP